MSSFFKKLFSFVFILVLSGDAYAQLFRLSATFNDLASPACCLTLSPDGKFLITGDAAGKIDFRDAESGKIIHTEKVFSSAVDHINFNSTGRLMIVTTRQGEIKIYDFSQEKFIHSLYSPEYTDMRFALFSIADGFIYFNGQGRLYKTRSDLTQPAEKVYECDSTISNAVISDDRSALIFSCGNAVKVLNTRSDNITQELVISPSPIEHLALSAGNKLVTWSNDGTIVLRKYELNQLNPGLLLWFKAGSTGNMAFSHDGRLMVTGNVGTWARIWKPYDRNVMQELFGHKDEVTNFVFSSDDRTLFTASNDKTIKAWTLKTDDRKITAPVVDISKRTPVPSDTTKSTEQPAVQSDSGNEAMPAIELDNMHVPTEVGGRKVNSTSTIEVGDSTIDIYVFDNSTLDGDIMSLCFHNQWILSHYEVTKQKKKLTLQLKAGLNNYLVLFAENLGKTPPNTAAIAFRLKGRERIFRLESDLKSCSSINFIYKKK